MQELVSEFFTELHKSALKPMGFKKERHRFSRQKEGYVEIVDFQGSSWNQPGEPWRFCINIAVKFTDIELEDKPSWLNRVYAEGRIEGLVPEADAHYDLSETTCAELIKRIPSLIEKASKALPASLPKAKKRVIAGYVSPLPVPDTWDDI